MLIAPAAATCNIIIITDPTGKDPNGVAAGSMSFQKNMFQSTFLFSPNEHFAVLSGGEGQSIPRLQAIVAATQALKNGATPAQAAALANNYPQIRLMIGSPTQGAAVGGYFAAYVVIVDNDGTITVTPYSGGLAVIPPGKKGAIIHLLNTDTNPMQGTAPAVREQTAVNMGKMIRDGYPATYILGQAFKEVSNDANEKYGGGGVNLVSGITTGDMFTPKTLNTTGYPMNTPYSKVCPTDGWSVGFPEADNYQTCPNDGTPLKTVYAYDALTNAITVTGQSVQVSVYGSDELGIQETTQEIVSASVKKHGYNNVEIANSINTAIDNGILVGVNHVEPKDVNVKESTRAVGVYFKPLPGDRSAPPWNLPISSSILELIGNIQTAIGLILVLLVLFRSRLIDSFKR
ncbi:MAG TPA: hypothetical protein VK426_04940 [Methanobacterium sp.]|nr:hypothetical protein [Methanobacterium sp.]